MYWLLADVDHRLDEWSPMVEVENQLPTLVMLDFPSKSRPESTHGEIRNHFDSINLLNLVAQLR